MKIKLDENIGRSGVDLMRRHGHDVVTVRDERLAGASDEVVFAACVSEGRILITLDRDFGQVLRFPPSRSAGIVLLDPGTPASVATILRRLDDFLRTAASRAVSGELWIVEAGRVRIHLPKDDG